MKMKDDLNYQGLQFSDKTAKQIYRVMVVIGVVIVYGFIRDAIFTRIALGG